MSLRAFITSRWCMGERNLVSFISISFSFLFVSLFICISLLLFFYYFLFFMLSPFYLYLLLLVFHLMSIGLFFSFIIIISLSYPHLFPFLFHERIMIGKIKARERGIGTSFIHGITVPQAIDGEALWWGYRSLYQLWNSLYIWCLICFLSFSFVSSLFLLSVCPLFLPRPSPIWTVSEWTMACYRERNRNGLYGFLYISFPSFL